MVGVVVGERVGGVVKQVSADNLDTTHTLEYTKDKYNAKIRK
jgi:hypothetical protein